jgi:hypothetical protein
LIALLLAPVPLALGALALGLLRPLGRAERAVVACAAVAFAACALFSPAAPMRDAWTHYEHLRLSLSEPRRLLDPWDRPGFMLLYAAPAALGLAGARLASLVPAALALAASMRAARALGLARPWLVGLLLVAQYDFFGQASSTMTELPFAAALAVAVWGWAEDRPWVAAAGAGWCAVTRPEGALFAMLFAAALAVRRRRLAPAAAAFVPLALWGVANALVWLDPLWWIHGNPYRGMVAPRLELGQLADSYFFEALRQGQPPVLIVLEAAGALFALSARGRRVRFLLAPVLASFLVLTFLKIGATDEWRESRYLVAVAPALALLGAAGLEEALATSPALAPPLLLALAALGAARELLWNWRAAVGGLAWAETAAHAAFYSAAALLWAFRRRLSPRVALGLLLAIPLACSPPGAFSRHRLEASRDRGTTGAAPEAVFSPSATPCRSGVACARAPRADAGGRVP